MNNKRYRIKVNGMYVSSVSTFTKTIDLRDRDFKKGTFLEEDKKDYVLSVFPNAEVKSYSIVEGDDF